MAAPLPRGAQFLADLILRPVEEPPLLHVFNRDRGIPDAKLAKHQPEVEYIWNHLQPQR